MQCGRLGLLQPHRPLCVLRTLSRQKPGGNREGQFPGGVAGAGFGFALPLRPRRPVVGALVGGIGPASAPGVAGSAGVTGAATDSAAGAGSAGVGAGGGIRGDLAARDAPGTVVSVSRSLDFFARIEMMTGETPGVVPVGRTNSPNCIATPV